MAAAELTKTVLKDNANLKAYYRFESGALTTDSSGNSNTLTNNNTVGEGTGVYGGCADFGTGNTNKYLSVASDLGLTKTLSLSCWVKLNEEIAANSVVFISKSHATGSYSFYIGYEYNGGTRRVFFENLQQTAGSDTYSRIYKTVTLGTSTWHHFSLASNGTNFYCYFDGQYVGTGTVQPNGTWPITTRLTIGCSSFNIAGFSSALIDDAFVFSSALSADQIKELYEGRFLGEAWPQSGLVAGYHFNGSSTDFSGNNKHGTDTAITYSQANGKFGQGAGFNGSSSFIDCGTSATLRPTTFTIVAWVKPSGTGIKTIKSGGASNSYQFRINNVTPELIHEQAGGIATATATVTLNVWNHVAVSYDASGNYAFYVNGNSAGTGTNLKSFSFGNFFIGKQYSGAEWFNGAIDELVLYNRVLTAQEIRRMYAVGTGKLQ